MSEREIKTVYEDEDFCVKIEKIEEVLFLHCYVDNYSKSVKKQMDAVFEEIKEAALFYGWDALHSYTNNPKFAKILKGGFKINEVEHLGQTYEVWRWELIPSQ